LLLPQAAATDAEGSFVSVGTARFGEGAEFRFRPLLTALNDSGGLQAATLRSSSLVLHQYEAPFDEVGAVQLVGPRRHTRLEVQDATMELVPGEQRGYLALFENHEGSALFTPRTGLVLRPQERTEFAKGGTVGTSVEKGNREQYSHAETVTQLHFATSAQGRLAFEGGGLLKLYGPDVVLRAGDVERVLRTGLERDSQDAVHKGIRRWVVLEFSNATFEASSADPWLLAGADVEASWDGAMGFHPVSGSLRTEDREYVASGAPASLAGTLTARLGVVKTEGAPLLTTWRVSGALDRTSLEVGQVLPAAPAAEGPGWGLLVGALAVVSAAGGGAFAALRHRRRPAPPKLPPGVEDCLEVATAAAAQEDWPEAAEWFSRARRLAPTSARLCGDLAFVLEQMGEREEALRLYAEGSRLSTDGEADFNGGFAALRAGRPPAEVAGWLARALERSPELAADLEDDESLGEVRGVRAFREAMARARGRREQG
jgi:tetratricopeptide (TPR) repeat protein